ncbi:group 3 secretory phospholipase A2 [Aphis craccivora]|uniref:phospholipase A2 n=1 Tax=Aphis craccivora TaxID=307492 RepID=A0A6G0ZDT1_APHCR|nr:group 3 secretory phospholipase A2 [Aphis craccivora]
MYEKTSNAARLLKRVHHAIYHVLAETRKVAAFRSCLKTIGTGSANLIGKLFFNVVQTKCFVLKRVRVCTKKTWWGKCHRHENRKKAYIRNNLMVTPYKGKEYSRWKMGVLDPNSSNPSDPSSPRFPRS